MIKAVRIYTNSGKYDIFAPTKTMYNIGLHVATDHWTDTYSVIVDDEPDTKNWLPSDVIDFVEKEKKSLLFSSSAEKDEAIAIRMRKVVHSIDRFYINEKIEGLMNEVNRLRSVLEGIE